MQEFSSDHVPEAVDLARQTLMMAVQLSLPVLAAGLLIGIVISIMQTATSIQEQTLTFIPKMFIVVAVLFVMMPWFLQILMDYFKDLVLHMGDLFQD